jgi:hypothetical protein
LSERHGARVALQIRLDGRWSRQERWATTQMRRSVPSAVIGQGSPAVARARRGFVSESGCSQSPTGDCDRGRGGSRANGISPILRRGRRPTRRRSAVADCPAKKHFGAVLGAGHDNQPVDWVVGVQRDESNPLRKQSTNRESGSLILGWCWRLRN